VEDKSSIHDFHLMGKGLNKATTVSFVGDKTWRVTFKAARSPINANPHAPRA